MSKEQKIQDVGTEYTSQPKFIDIKNNLSENELNYFSVFENIVTELTHLLNLPFLEKFREDTLVDIMKALGWTDSQILDARRKSVFRSNWNRNWYVKQRAESIGRGDLANLMNR